MERNARKSKDGSKELKLTENQVKLLSFFKLWVKDNNQPPSYEYMSKMTDLTRSTVILAYRSLVDLGYIQNAVKFPAKTETTLNASELEVLAHLRDVFKKHSPMPKHKDLANAVGLSVLFVSHIVSHLKNEGFLYQTLNEQIHSLNTIPVKTTRPPWKLTGIQEKLFWYLTRELSDDCKMPHLRELAEKTGHCISTVNHALDQLVKKGYISKRKAAKGIEIKILHELKDENMLEVPIIGDVIAGTPSLYEEPLGSIKVNPALAGGRELFGLRVIDKPRASSADDLVLVFCRWPIPVDANVILAKHNDILILAKLKCTQAEVLLSEPGSHTMISSRDAPNKYKEISPNDSLRTIGVLISGFKNGDYLYL